MSSRAIEAVNPAAGSSQTNPAIVQERSASTSTRTVVVAAPPGTQTILAANANRLGATIENNSNGNLFLALGAAGTLTSFTVRMVPDAYYEVPFHFTGIITGEWTAGAVGNAQVTELTP